MDRGVETSGFTGATTTKGVSTNFIMSRASESQSLDNLPNRVKSTTTMFGANYQDYIICPPASFLSPGERFIAQEQGLAVQQSRLEDVVGSYKRLIGVNPVSCVRKAIDHASYGERIPTLRTKRSQIMSEMTINSNIKLDSVGTPLPDNIFEILDIKQNLLNDKEKTDYTSKTSYDKSLHQDIVECFFKSDAVDKPKQIDDVDGSQTSPSSSSPETQVEDVKSEKIPQSSSFVIEAKNEIIERIKGDECSTNESRRTFHRNIRGSVHNSANDVNGDSHPNDSISNNIGSTDFSNDENITKDTTISDTYTKWRHTGAIPKTGLSKQSRNSVHVSRINKPIRKVVAKEQEALLLPKFPPSEHSSGIHLPLTKSFTTCGETLSQSQPSLSPQLQGTNHSLSLTSQTILQSAKKSQSEHTILNPEDKEYYILCLDVKKFTPFHNRN